MTLNPLMNSKVYTDNNSNKSVNNSKNDSEQKIDTLVKQNDSIIFNKQNPYDNKKITANLKSITILSESESALIDIAQACPLLEKVKIVIHTAWPGEPMEDGTFKNIEIKDKNHSVDGNTLKNLATQCPTLTLNQRLIHAVYGLGVFAKERTLINNGKIVENPLWVDLKLGENN